MRPSDTVVFPTFCLVAAMNILRGRLDAIGLKVLIFSMEVLMYVSTSMASFPPYG
jgi:hypothetical protein